MMTFSSAQFRLHGPSARCASVCVAIATWLAASTVYAQQTHYKQSSIRGKTLFEKEWQHAAVEIPERGTMNERQYRSVLQKLPGDGLGPMFNATSCEACHPRGGAAGVDHNVTLVTLDPQHAKDFSTREKNGGLSSRNSIARQQLRRQIDDLFPGFVAPNGNLGVDVVLHESSARPFFNHYRDSLKKGVPGGVSDEWFDRHKRTSEAIAQKPVIAGRQHDLDYYLSQRNSPPLFGLGLIDRIERKRLISIASSQAQRSKGRITGRLGTGKFGWRAQTPTLRRFVMGACAGELGLQLTSTPQPPDMADDSYISLGSDLSNTQVTDLVSYVSSLPVPTQERDPGDDWAGAHSGKRLFSKIGCNQCHVEHVYPARGIFSDLLLHDMGEHLQAPSPASTGSANVASIKMPVFPAKTKFSMFGSVMSYYGNSTTVPAPYVYKRPLEPTFPRGSLSEELLAKNARLSWQHLQREWRTPPLWGVADSAPYLHDGRAKTLDAAIRWHGGEAAASVEAYRSLDKPERAMIIAFLNTLHAPIEPAGPPEEGELEWLVSQDAEGSHQDKAANVQRVFAQGN